MVVSSSIATSPVPEPRRSSPMSDSDLADGVELCESMVSVRVDAGLAVGLCDSIVSVKDGVGLSASICNVKTIATFKRAYPA